MNINFTDDKICLLSQSNPYKIIKKDTLFDAAFKYKKIDNGLNNILKLFSSLEDVSKHFLTKDTLKLDLQSFDSCFSELIRATIQSNSFFEKSIKLGELYCNPSIYSSCFQPTIKTSLNDLKNSKVLLCFSKGKESTLLRHIFQLEDINVDTVYIHDCIQHSEKPIDFQIYLGNIDAWSPLKQPFLTIGITTPIVVYQRLLLWAYAHSHDYDLVIFGDEIDNQALYTVDGSLYPSSSFFQSQYFYNALNNYEISKTRLISGLMNFSQERIYEYVIKKNLLHFSCFRNNSGWCNNCTKCKTTSYFAKKYSTNMYFESGLDINCGENLSKERKGFLLDFSNFYKNSLIDTCKPLMNDGFKEYYTNCILKEKPDNKVEVYYDFGDYNSFEYEVLEIFKKHWDSV